MLCSKFFSRVLLVSFKPDKIDWVLSLSTLSFPYSMNTANFYQSNAQEQVGSNKRPGAMTLN